MAASPAALGGAGAGPSRFGDPRSTGIAGAVLFAAAAGWTLASAAVSGGRPGPAVALIAATAGSIVAGYLVAGVRRWVVPAAVAVVAGGLVFVSDVYSRRPLGGPFGYRNATGIFYALAVVAALMVAAEVKRPEARAAAGVATLAFATVPFAGHAAAASIVMIVLPAAAMIALLFGGPRAGIAVSAGILAVSLVGTVLLGAVHEGGGGSSTARRRLGSSATERRLDLWHEAFRLMDSHPVTGVGPGRFADESMITHRDSDARWAHNGFLQQGAETGLPGFVLLVALFGWALWAIAGFGGGGLSVLGAAAVAVLGVGACVDYVLHFASLPVMAAALAGAAMRPASKS